MGSRVGTAVGWSAGVESGETADSSVGAIVGPEAGVKAMAVVGSNVGMTAGLGLAIAAAVPEAVGCVAVVMAGADGVATPAAGVSVGTGDVEQATDTTPNVRSATRMNFMVLSLYLHGAALEQRWDVYSQQSRLGLEVSSDTFILGPERRSDGICDDNPEAGGLSLLLQGEPGPDRQRDLNPAKPRVYGTLNSAGGIEMDPSSMKSRANRMVSVAPVQRRCCQIPYPWPAIASAIPFSWSIMSSTTA